MAGKQKLKVFRMPIGFHDAYVAAPSQKAALAAWGSEADLFARGIAELVIDEALAREPLEHPGKVIRRLRGSEEERRAAAASTPITRQRVPNAEDAAAPPVTRKAPARHDSARRGFGSKIDSEQNAKPQRKTKSRAKLRPTPRPSPDGLEAAEGAVRVIGERQKREKSELQDRQRTLDRERRAMEVAHKRERRAAERAVESERKAYVERLDRWRGERS